MPTAKRNKTDSKSASKVLYLDQNAWIALARGAWDKTSFPREHLALTTVVNAVQGRELTIPLSFTNIYETAKINDPVRRANIARTQALISGGRVFRGRRRILKQTLSAYLAARFALQCSNPDSSWFLSDLWCESAEDYSSESYGYAIPESMLELIRANPAEMLFDYLTMSDETVRLKAVRHYSAASAELVARIEKRRILVAGEALAMRRRAYGAQLIFDEVDFILVAGRQLGLSWQDVRDIGSSLARRIVVDIPIFNVERELAVRLEDQERPISENDLRDMAAISVTLPLADIFVGEKLFVNLARQARLGEQYATTLLTSVFDIASKEASFG